MRVVPRWWSPPRVFGHSSGLFNLMRTRPMPVLPKCRANASMDVWIDCRS